MSLMRYFYTILTLLVCLALGGCAFESGKAPNYLDHTKNANYYLRQAKNSTEANKIDWILLAVQALTKENRVSDASKLLANLPKRLTAKQNNDKKLSIGEIWVKVNKPFDLAYIQIPSLDWDQRFRYYSLKLSIDRKKNDINGQAHDYIFIEKYAREENKSQIVHNTWLFFNSLTNDKVKLVVLEKEDLVLRGWIDLLYIYTKNSQTYYPKKGDSAKAIAKKEQQLKERLTQEMFNWSSYYTYHPAQAIVTKLIGVRQFEVKDKNAKKVALLVPLNGASGIFGETIRQGYLDAMSLYPNEPQQNVIILDTTSGSIRSLVSQAEDQGAKAIVGPLLKEDVQAIKRLSPDLPVLALNKVEDEYNLTFNPSNMCFLSLSPEDEAKDAAQHIYSQGKRKPLLLVPKNELGQRVAKNFAMEWEISSQGRAQVYVQYFDGEEKLRSNMNKNVGIALIGESINSDYVSSDYSAEQTRSKNFDSIYVYATHNELNLLKPMIEMKTNILLSSPSSPTMFTSSQSNVANASTDFYLDMDGIQFADIPMIMNLSADTAAIPVNIRNNNSLMRLYAMGIDAWRLTNRFNQLTSNQLYKFDGMTGKLSTTYECDITRSLVWKRYANGKIEPVKSR